MFAVKTFEERDEFGRKNIAEKVIKLLDSDINVSPLVIDGAWGTGKTEFCCKLISLMEKNETHHVIYVDAFQADHANAPLLTVLAEVIKVLPNETSKKRFIRKALPYVRYGLKTVGKAGLAHLLRQDVGDLVEEFNKEIQDTADKIIDVSVETILKDHVNSSKNLKALQNALETVAKVKPIILFIDELDRCRPDFAVHMLEVIKHTFDVEGVQFVLITNTQQLKASINHCYGETIDARRYLDKFLKFTFVLPKESTEMHHQNSLASIIHFQNLCRKSQCLSATEIYQENIFFKLIKFLISYHQISLREIETIVRYFEIYQLMSNSDPIGKIITGYKLLRILSIFIFCLDSKLVNSIRKSHVDALEIGNFLSVNKCKKLDKNERLPKVQELLSVMIGGDCQLNSELFTPDVEDNERIWQPRIGGLFEGDLFFNEKGQYLNIIKKVFAVLDLSSDGQ